MCVGPERPSMGCFVPPARGLAAMRESNRLVVVVGIPQIRIRRTLPVAPGGTVGPMVLRSGKKISHKLLMQQQQQQHQ